MSEEMTVYATYSHPDNGRELESVETKNILVVGKRYEVDKFCVFPFSTDVYLKGIGRRFNSVFFDFERNGEAYDPTRDIKNWRFLGGK